MSIKPPDTCPNCGAKREVRIDDEGYTRYRCQTSYSWQFQMQSDECSRYVRTRISQLRMMAEASKKRMWDVFYKGKDSQSARLEELYEGCLLEMRSIGACLRQNETERLCIIDRRSVEQ